MNGMTLDELKQTMAELYEIEFFYCGEQYNFQKEPAEASRTKISVWRVDYNPECIYSVTIADGEPFVDDLINAKIFHDGKSIAEAAADVVL